MDMEKKNMLIEKAASALLNAHAPYSGYKVGAALKTKDGDIFTGCNMENSSYGLTMCAERNAFASAIQAGAREFSAIAIATDGSDIPYPCGACRQVISEFCSDDFIILVTHADIVEEYRLDKLLPKRFSKNNIADNNRGNR